MNQAVNVHQRSTYEPSRDSEPFQGNAIYHAGRKLLIDSVDAGKEFCKFMLALSIGAVPVYLALLIIAMPYDSDQGWKKGLALLVPGCIFLLSAIVFSIAYFPANVHFSTDVIDEVERARFKIIRQRSRLVKAGFMVFTLGTFMAMVAVIKAHL